MMSLERAKEMKDSILWGDIMEEMDREIFLLSQRLLTCSPEQLQALQTEIRLLAGLKNLPDKVISREEGIQGKLG